MDWGDWGWAWWLGAALLAVIVEMFVLDFVLTMLAVSAGVAALIAFLGLPLWAQVAGFAISAAILLRVLRPWLLENLRRRTVLVETNVHALVGRDAVVTAPTTALGGQVKLAGEIWTARTEARTELEVGSHVHVVRIDGATAVVEPGPPDRPAASADPVEESDR